MHRDGWNTGAATAAASLLWVACSGSHPTDGGATMDAGGDAQSDAAADDAGGIDAARRDGGPDSGPPSCTPKELSMVIPRVVWNGAELAVVTGTMGESRGLERCRDVTWRRLSPDGAELPPTTTLRTG